MTVLLGNSLVLIVGILVLAFCGYFFKALSFSGAIGTLIVGALIALGYQGYGLLLIGIFFITSSFWSKFKRGKKEHTEELHEKGSRRDIIQVLANGFVPALFSGLNFLFPAEYWVYGFITSIAVANSDTWASEIGTLSIKKPFSILSWEQVERGTSGAISWLGTCAAIAGATLIACFAYIFWNAITIESVIYISIIGVLGCFIDTIFGATIQASYCCNVCGLVMEKKEHCNQKGKLLKGHPIVTNDVVNISAIILASIIGIFIKFI
ncbi:DUF92 domain-containing protein [Sutcliffiella rhizosphaerae]|uniref:DUF92 domain-containing protein n=1 Tax=Sutcliffiella rhizosphaerae TaxID=2880967 RepID=A0ABN8A2S8_9BACI|nr:DUF92 domain-containing protein [Sutcliffiella rhizosphaerae]CAG9619304.1 hypothetical protein BACCIP111883_00071 [Sutcliffiella rhizosphaerae]